MDLTAAEARRVALAAQGFGARNGRVDRRRVRELLARIAPLQIDSVNVLVRAHYLPVFSRFGAYEADLIDRMAYRHRDLFEYWGHEASFMPMAQFPLLRWRMDPAEAHPRFRAWAEGNGKVIDAVAAQIADRGPLGVSGLEDGGKRSGPWWGWQEGKTALEWLFVTGAVTTADRRNFERIYDLTERVIPARVLSMRVPSKTEAWKQLLMHAARALGVGTARDLSDYFRLNGPASRPLINELVEEGKLRAVRVQGWKDAAYLHPKAEAPRRVDARALISPFDPIVWERARAERVFGFTYRIEIYVPEPKRVYGYYVLPFLVGDRLVARVDLKADRKAGTLLVRAAYAEAKAPAKTASALAAELRLLAGWLRLERVTVEERGDLAASLRKAAG